MPKLCIYLALCTSLVFFNFATLCNPQLESLGAGTFRIYSREDISSPLVQNRISIATGFIYIACSNDAAELRAKFTHIDGESLTLDTPVPTQQILQILGYRAVESLQIGSLHITYAYSSNALAFVTHNDMRVNLQIAQRNNQTTVGWPVILSSH